MKISFAFLALALAFAPAVPSHADVRDTRENGFAIESTVMADASPARTYRALVNAAMWWDPKHTWSGSSRNLTLDPRAGGCFCEKLADGGSIQHGRVIFAQPGKLLRLDAPLGPLQDMAVTRCSPSTSRPMVRAPASR